MPIHCPRTLTFDPVPPRAIPERAYVVLADGEVDIVLESLSLARDHVADLRAMGCDTEVHSCPWEEQDALIERLTGIPADTGWTADEDI